VLWLERYLIKKRISRAFLTEKPLAEGREKSWTSASCITLFKYIRYKNLLSEEFYQLEGKIHQVETVQLELRNCTT